MENPNFKQKTIGKLYYQHDETFEKYVVTVGAFAFKNETCIKIQSSRINPQYPNREKNFQTVVINESEYNDFVDLLRAALDQCAKYVENVQD